MSILDGTGYNFLGRENDQRRVPLEERKTYQIKQVTQKTHEIVNLSARGFSNIDIAEILNITKEYVSQVLNCELGILLLNERRNARNEEASKDIEKIRVLTAKAVNVYHELFDNESGEYTGKDKLDGAKTVLLELSGLRAPTKIQSTSVTLTSEDIERLKNRGRSFIDITPKQGDQDE